ncbi:MAG: rhomboid family intramembrane serine protease [Planctomycetota bacterium]|nr:rhomboid family intramembrane serine protease [Planctomycetota bacterium]
MGIENRDYLRDDYDDTAGSFRKPSPKPMTLILVVVTVAVFVLQLITSRPTVRPNVATSLVQEWLALDFDHVVFQGQIWRLVTYAFCHDQDNILHIVFNMMVLYSIGGALRQLLGDREFLWFYLVAAVFAGICSLAFYRLIGVNAMIIGASCATMGIFCVVAMHYPREKVLLMGIIPIEFRWLLVAFVAIDAVPMISQVTGFLKGTIPDLHVANSAHIGGLVFGFLYFRWSMRITRWWDQFAGRMKSRRQRGHLRVFTEAPEPESNLNLQVDAILEKISREGEASLTARERKILAQASRQYRKGKD